MDRRLVLKKIGLGLAGFGLVNTKSSASGLDNINNIYSNNDNNIIYLSSNENPYGPSPAARRVFGDNTAISNRYNWTIASDLIAAIAKKNNIGQDSILIGAGSTELLDLVARFAANEKGTYVIADPSYRYWTVVADQAGLKKVTVPLNATKQIDLNAMLAAIRPDTRLVYICNPNNPSGTICERLALEEFIAQVPANVLIMVDEAYLEFTNQQSLSNFTSKHSNLIILKTFSKIYGLAGARIGYALAAPLTIEALSRLQSSPNNSVSVLSRLAAIASLNDEDFVQQCKEENDAVKNYVTDALRKLNCKVIFPKTNFIYFSLENYKHDYFQRLKENNIEGTYIYEEQGKWTRITIGTLAEMRKFVRALQ